MKVLHLPANIASQISVTVQALRGLGVDARGLVLGNYAIQDPAGIELLPTPQFRRQQWFRRRVRRWLTRWTICHAIRRADVIHWYYSWALPKSYDVQYAARLGKVGIVEFWGSDIRIPRIASIGNPYMANMYRDHPEVEKDNEQASVARQRMFAQHGMSCLIPGPDILSCVDCGAFPNPYQTYARINLKEYPVSYPDVNKRRPCIVHMPSDKVFKGTDAVLRAVEKLQQSYAFDFRLVEGVKHADALQIVKDCDVFLDQFVIGVHGLAALESMSFGKPTVCYINPLMFSRYPADLPIVVANQDNLAEVLEGLLKDGLRRHEIGVQSRAYVEKYHDAGVIAKQLVGIYEELIEKRKQRR